MSSAPDPTKEIQITNDTNSSISVLMPTVSSQSQADGGVLVYDQDLEVLTAVDGATAIPVGSAKTFVLDQTYVDPITKKTEYSTLYNLLPSTSNWYSPVANIGVMQSFTDPPSYPAQTVTAASAAAFLNAAVFIQTISAYPTSALTTSYQQAMNQAAGAAAKQADGSAGSSAAVADSISRSVDDFFKGTKTFQDVTLAAVVAVQSSYNAFPFVWAQFANSTTTYYLYSSNGTATSFVGKLSLTRPASLDVTVVNAGYTCTFTPAADPSDTTKVDVNTSAAKSLSYIGGLFVDDVSSDVPQVAVKGTFQVKRLFTTKPADTQIIAVLTGTVDGSVCIGFDSPQLSSSKAGSDFWDTLFHPKNGAQIFQSIMTMGGAIMFLAFIGQSLYGIYKWASGLAAAKQPTTAEMLQQQQSDLQDFLKKQIDDAVGKLSEGKQGAPADPDAAAEVVASERQAVSDNQSAARLEDGVKAEAASLEELAEFESQMNESQLQNLETVGGKVRDSSQALEQADQANLDQVVSEQTTALTDISSDVTTLTTEVSSVLSEEAVQAIKANGDLVTDVTKSVDDAAKNEADDEGDTDPTSDDPFIPEEV